MAMMHEITVGLRNKKGKRKGRGESSGMGKTSGRGTKGAGAHGGDVAWTRGREGGQTPIYRRLPKRGFSNDRFERRFHIVNLSDLNEFNDGAAVDAAALIAAGLVKNDRQPVKILGDGELSKKLIVTAGWFSKSAQQKITAAGGQTLNLQGQPFEFPKPKKKFVPREGAKKGGKKAEAAPAEGAAEAKTEAPKAE